MDNLNEQGLKEALQSLRDMQKTCKIMEVRAEAKMTEAETELNTARKLRSFVDLELDTARTLLQRLQDQKVRNNDRPEPNLQT